MRSLPIRFATQPNWCSRTCMRFSQCTEHRPSQLVVAKGCTHIGVREDVDGGCQPQRGKACRGDACRLLFVNSGRAGMSIRKCKSSALAISQRLGSTSGHQIEESLQRLALELGNTNKPVANQSRQLLALRASRGRIEFDLAFDVLGDDNREGQSSKYRSRHTLLPLYGAFLPPEEHLKCADCFMSSDLRNGPTALGLSNVAREAAS